MRLRTRATLYRKKTSWALRHPRRALKSVVRSWYLVRTTPVLRFPPQIAEVLRRRRAKFDWLLAERSPALATTSIGNRVLIDIDSMYPARMEVRTDPAPYRAFAKILVDAGITQDAESIMDVGCSTGHLLLALSDLLPAIEVRGIEYFPYQKEAAPVPVRAAITIADVRLPLCQLPKSDVVICTEVGEHVDPAAQDVFLANLQHLCEKTLVLTWSEGYPPPTAPPQHLCSLSRKAVFRLIESRGFQLDRQRTHRVRMGLERSNVVYPWWLDSLSVWRKR